MKFTKFLRDEFWFIWLMLLIFLLFLYSALNAQVCNNYKIPDSLVKNIKYNIIDIQSGTCASPDGSMQQTFISPPSYAWLQTNGYCYTIGPTKNFTMCFTFISTGTSVSLNSGYSSTGCATISFSGFNLYKCNPSCILIGSGFSFSGLIPGQCYVWCFSGSCTGPGPGFDHVCPYWMDTTPMPVEMLYFTGTNISNINVLNWATATEQNNDYFVLDRSLNGKEWTSIAIIKGAGNSIYPLYYSYDDKTYNLDTINYYRIEQVDYNENFIYYNTISIRNYIIRAKLLKIVDILGNQVDESAIGIKIYIYSDGTLIKKY